MDEELEKFRSELEEIGKRARRAALALGGVSADVKVRALELMARTIDRSREELKKANGRDLDAARSAGLSAPKLDRLTLTELLSRRYLLISPIIIGTA